MWSEAARHQGPSVGDVGDDGPAFLPLQATRALHELLLEPSRRTEVQAFFPALFTALLFQIPLLKVEGATEAAREQHHVTQWMDPVRYPGPRPGLQGAVLRRCLSGPLSVAPPPPPGARPSPFSPLPGPGVLPTHPSTALAGLFRKDSFLSLAFWADAGILSHREISAAGDTVHLHP